MNRSQLVRTVGLVAASVTVGYAVMSLTSAAAPAAERSGSAEQSEKMKRNREFLQQLNQLAADNAKTPIPTRRPPPAEEQRQQR